MKIIDLPDIERVNRKPDKVSTIISSGSFSERGFLIKQILLKQYVESTDNTLGDYSLITSEVFTDRGSIEMIYDEGFRGKDALNGASEFLIEHLGISGLILRSIIALEAEIKNNNI